MDKVKSILKEASKYGLESEVSVWANKFMQEHPNLSRTDAHELAFREWVK